MLNTLLRRKSTPPIEKTRVQTALFVYENQAKAIKFMRENPELVESPWEKLYQTEHFLLTGERLISELRRNKVHNFELRFFG